MDLKDSSGITSLMRAAATGQLELVKMLLKAGASVSEVNNEKETVIFYALRGPQKNSISIIRLLKVYGVDINHQNSFGVG